jgi:hypothetical protein
MKTNVKSYLSPLLFSFVCLMLLGLGIAALYMTGQISSSEDRNASISTPSNPLVAALR